MFLSNADVLESAQSNPAIVAQERDVPCFWILNSFQELVKLVSTGGTEDLLAVNIVAYMW